MDQFCDRNVDICNISTETWKSLKYKAAYGFDVVATLAKDIKEAGKQDYSPVYKAQPGSWQEKKFQSTHGKQYVSSNSPQNTLTGRDLEPSWSFDREAKTARPAI